MVRDYPYRGLGKNDATLDLDPLLLPDYCQDVRQPWPKLFQCGDGENEPTGLWDAVMSDPPYSEDDSTHYPFGVGNYPEPSQILKRASEVLKPGGKVGIMHYQVTRPPKDFIFIACVGIVMGFGNKIRAYSVFQKPYG
jgi:hypothetical protein